MKNNHAFLILGAMLFLFACKSERPLLHNGQALIHANTEVIDYKVADDWYLGAWSIAPEVEHDTLQVLCYESSESFLFKTDKDSISLKIQSGTTESFYVLLKDSAYAHTLIQGVPFKAQSIEFDQKEKNEQIQLNYQKGESAYLNELRKEYPIDQINGLKSDQEKVLQVLNWTNSRWKHDGNNSPEKNDAISILKEAETGKNFPCFAFAIVLKDQLNALGFKARTVYLKTKNAETSYAPPGHVATEVYLNDLEKWVFLDGQWNVMPTLNDRPLNAVELQKAIGENYDALTFTSINTIGSKRSYVEFVYPYLFYLDTSLDHRYDPKKPKLIDGKKSLMLVPLGAKNLTKINFWKMDVDYCVYTHSLLDFYAKPL